MKLTKRIQRMINKKLSFTNGWHIEEERYNELVKELTKQIILTIEEEWNKRRHPSNSASQVVNDGLNISLKDNSLELSFKQQYN